MCWFFKKQRPVPRVKTDIGTFSFDQTGWMTDPSSNKLIFQICSPELDFRVVDRATQLVKDLDLLSRKAIDYARTSGADVVAGAAHQMMLEAVDITDVLEDKCALTFGVAGHPDYTVTVEFRDERPYLVWSAD
jgi:hypothetical protein